MACRLAARVYKTRLVEDVVSVHDLLQTFGNDVICQLSTPIGPLRQQVHLTTSRFVNAPIEEERVPQAVAELSRGPIWCKLKPVCVLLVQLVVWKRVTSRLYAFAW